MTAPPPPEPTRVIVVTNVLPVHLERDDEGRWTASWDEEIGRPESSLSRYLAIGVRKLDTPHVFVGSPECFVPKAERAAVEEAIAAAGLSCVCVYHEPGLAHRFYQGFCKGTLWPVMHNVIDVYNTASVATIGADDEPQLPGVPRRSTPSSGPAASDWQAPRSWNPVEGQETCWPAYCEVNRSVAQAVVETYHEGDLVWVHHYHLMLVPSYLARKLRNANIGAPPFRPRAPARSARRRARAPLRALRARQARASYEKLREQIATAQEHYLQAVPSGDVQHVAKHLAEKIARHVFD